ncbi:hypothetical protein quinque_015348 [Culex quinquefasciatus]
MQIGSENQSCGKRSVSGRFKPAKRPERVRRVVPDDGGPCPPGGRRFADRQNGPPSEITELIAMERIQWCGIILIILIKILCAQPLASSSFPSLKGGGGGAGTSGSGGAANGTENLSSRLVSQIVFNSTLNHLAVDRTTGMVYVGAVNKLYQISPDLNILAAVTTGPHNDSNECSILECPSDVVRRPTDNWNKVLLIDSSAPNLIVCGSLFQGVCQIRSLQNISVVEHRVQEAVVANVANASTVAFIAPGPPVPSENNVMYVGVTFTGNSPYRSEIPAVASRSLARDKMFQIASAAVTTGTRIFVTSQKNLGKTLFFREYREQSRVRSCRVWQQQQCVDHRNSQVTSEAGSHGLPRSDTRE